MNKGNAGMRNGVRSFWLYLAADVVLAAAIIGVFFLFLKIMPQVRQAQNTQNAMTDGGDATVPVETLSPIPSEKAEGLFEQNELEGAGQAAVIEPAETPETGSEAAADERSLFRERFAEFFTEETEIGTNSYTSPDISVRITEVTDREHGSLPFHACLADIHVASVEVLKAGFPIGHQTAEAEVIAIDNDAILAVNGDFYTNINRGLLVRNGIVLQNDEGTSDICVIYEDGTMRTYGPGEYSAEGILNQNPWQVWCFGPALLDENGRPKAEYNTSSVIYNRNPRTAIGYYEPGHYCLVVIDGRSQGYSNGASIRTLASFMSDLGCKAAYNLDGGASSVMVFEGETVNRPSAGGRKISDMVMICELPKAVMVFDEEG